MAAGTAHTTLGPPNQVFTLLSDALLIMVTSNLASSLDCTYVDTDAGLPGHTKLQWCACGGGGGDLSESSLDCLIKFLNFPSSACSESDQLARAAFIPCAACRCRHEMTESFLDAKPEWACWAMDSEQPAYAAGALFALLFYLPCSILLAPFVTADSDAIFQPPELDV